MRVLAYPALADGNRAVTIGSQGHGHEESSPEGGAGDAHEGRHSAELDNDGEGQRRATTEGPTKERDERGADIQTT